MLEPTASLKSGPLADLVEDLKRIFTADPRGAAAAERLADYSAHDDWRPYIFFRAQEYTRNLVERTEAFELLLLCWDAGQVSPIHNHEGQNCWMAVLDGPIREVQYQWEEGTGPPTARRDSLYQVGQVAFIRDEISLHDVRATPAKAAVSLHLYARPINECNVYCRRTGALSRRKLVYDSIRGVRCSRGSTARTR